MPIEVTEEMVQAARRLLPARWSMQDLTDAIAAAIEAAPVPELVFDFDWTEEKAAEFAELLREGMKQPHILLPGSCVPSEIDYSAKPTAVELGGVSEIADRYGVARSTVNGWMKRAEKIGMPAPLAILAAGPVYNLVALDPWYQAWKADSDAAA
jgi:hypothetical protein